MALDAERESATFSIDTMRNELNGGAEMSQFKQDIMDELDALVADGDACLPDDDADRPAARQQVMRMVSVQYKRLQLDAAVSPLKRQARLELLSLFDPSWHTRNGVHFGLWLGAIQGQGSDEQIEEWLAPSLFFQIFGCFAMTELGHGSFVRGLETTATYDPTTETFDLHSPTLTATKWWIGGAAHTATHAAVFAQLVLPDGSRPGVHTFVCPLRSRDDHSLLPGVSAGDCGHKFGRNGIDNGWLRFEHVRLPREALLCKHASVDTDGTFTRRGARQLQYRALIGARATMVMDSAQWLKAAVTIAVRYLAVRHQGAPLVPGGGEPALLDYATVQTRLMPLLATTYALSFTSLYMKNRAAPPGMTVSRSEAQDSAEEEAALPDLHATCAGLKAFATWACYHGIDTCRQAMGGMGYSGYTGLPRMLADFAVQCT